jgi:hypothetical protein
VESRQQAPIVLDADAGVQAVLRWYELVVAGRFNEAYAMWSARMKQNFPRQGNLDQRWANTASVSVSSIGVLSQSTDRTVVQIRFVETAESGAQQTFFGTWELVASPSGWLLDQPNF